MSEFATTAERALALARDGSCRSVNDIRQTLRREGRQDIQASLRGDVNRQLADLIRAFGPPMSSLASPKRR